LSIIIVFVCVICGVAGYWLGTNSVRAQRNRQDIKNAVLSAAIAGRNIDDAVKPWNDKAKEYDAMPRESAPERYTKVWIYGGAFHFHHINRRHPFSPDGWALLQIEEPFEEKKDAPQDVMEAVENIA